MQPSCARHALGLGRLAAVALVCVAAVLLINSGSASVPVPRALGVSRLVVRDPSDAGSAPEAPVQYGRSDSAALLESFHSRGGRVTAFIFYGRRRYVSALWPYLLAARRSGGSGLLSRVIFVANTHDKEDLVWLDALQAAHADYVLVQQPERVVTQSQNNADYCALYREVGSGEKGKQLVIKIDDDVVYVAQDALRNLVAAKLRAQHLLFVSANVVNHPLLAHVHQRVGLLDAADVESMVSTPEEAKTEDLKLLPDTWSFDYSTFSGDGWCAQPLTRLFLCASSDARCLPLRRQSGAHALLQHRLLLHRLRTLGEAATVSLYNAFRLWDFDAQGYGTGRWSINCFVYDPADLAAMDLEQCREAQDDENYLSNVYPGIVGKHCGATADALVAHAAYFKQREWLEEHSSVIEDYAALAQRFAAGQRR
jgi:hypothetical protein